MRRGLLFLIPRHPKAGAVRDYRPNFLTEFDYSEKEQQNQGDKRRDEQRAGAAEVVGEKEEHETVPLPARDGLGN
jgi:hypothetical protein